MSAAKKQMDDLHSGEGRSLGLNDDITIDEFRMRIRHKDFFDTHLPLLKDKNWKVANLLAAGYDNLPENVKKLIDKEIGVRRVTVLIPILPDDTDR